MDTSALPTLNQPLQVTQPTPQIPLSVTGAAPSTATSYQDPSQRGNFLVRNLPAIGGIVGGLAGLPLETVNAALPGAGLAANIATAAAGQAYGEALKQRLQGRPLDASEIAKQYGIGALQQGIGEGLGFVAKPITGKIGEALTKASGGLIKGQFAKGALRAGTTEELQKMGVFGASDIAKVASEVTGAEGKIPLFVKNTLNATNQKVDVMPLYNSLESLMLDNQQQFGPTTAKVLRDSLNRSIAQATGGQGIMQVGRAGTQVVEPSVLRNVSPEAAWNLMKGFEAQAEKAAQSGAFSRVNPQPLQRALYNVNSGLAAEVERALFKDLPLTPTLKSQLITELSSLKASNPSAYKYFVNKISQSQLLSDLRTIQAPIVDASTALQQAAEIERKTGGISGREFVTKGAEMAAPIAALSTGNIPLTAAAGIPLLADTELGSRLLSKGAYKAGQGLNSNIMNRLTPTLSRMTGVVAAKAPGVLSNMEATTPQPSSLPLSTGTAPAGLPITGMAAPMSASNSDAMPASALADILTLGYANPSFLSALGLSAEQRTKLGQVNQAESALDSLSKTFTEAGGGKGGLVGRLEAVTGKLAKGKVSAFREQRNATANQISLATGIDKEAILQSMPDVTDSAEGADAKLRQLRGLIASARSGAQVTGLGVTGLGGLLNGLGGAQPNYPSSALPNVTGLFQ